MNDADTLETPAERQEAAKPFLQALQKHVPALAMPSLYEVEDNLLALLDTEDVVPPEQEEAFRRDLARQLQAAVAKRDRVGGFIKMCEYDAEQCANEIRRLGARKKSRENAAEKLRGMVLWIIQALGIDEKTDKYRKLPGAKFTFSARACPDRISITDEPKIPVKYKRVTADMPAEIWEAICKLPGMLEPLPVASYYVDEPALKNALQSLPPCIPCKGKGSVIYIDNERSEQIPCPACKGTGNQPIPGAELLTNRYTLQIK